MRFWHKYQKQMKKKIWGAIHVSWIWQEISNLNCAVYREPTFFDYYNTIAIITERLIL